MSRKEITKKYLIKVIREYGVSQQKLYLAINEEKKSFIKFAKVIFPDSAPESHSREFVWSQAKNKLGEIVLGEEQ